MSIFDKLKNLISPKSLGKCPPHLINVGYNTEELIRILKRKKKFEDNPNIGGFDSKVELKESNWFTETLIKDGFEFTVHKGSNTEKKLIELFTTMDPFHLDSILNEISTQYIITKELIYILYNELDSDKIKLDEFTVESPTMDELLNKTLHTTT